MGSLKRVRGRRRLLALAAAASLAFGACAGKREPPEPAEPASILLITIDTLRADRLGLYGYFRDTSPHLDRLAEESVVFTRAVTTMATTLPAHVSLLTSLYPTQHGVRGNFQHLGRALETGDRIRSLPQILAARGWETAAFVGATPLKRASGIAAGFATFDQPAKESRRAGPVIDRALAWLEGRTGDRPFFLWIHLWDPHHPYAPPPDFERVFRETEEMRAWMEERGFSGLEDPDVLRQNNDYDDEIRYADREIGRLVDRLRELGLYQELTLVVTSDHGEGLGQHDWLRHGRIYNEQIYVPLILRLPPRLGFAGQRRDDPASVIDVVPTLAGRLQLPLDENERRRLEGVDLLAGGRGRPYVFVERVYRSRTPWEEGDKYALLADDWKYFHLTEAPDQLYHLGTDPHEFDDVIDSHPEVAATMRARLDEILLGLAESAVELAPGELSDERRRELEALGYVE